MKPEIIQITPVSVLLSIALCWCLSLPTLANAQGGVEGIDKIEAYFRMKLKNPRTIRLTTGTDRGGELLCYADKNKVLRICVTIGLSNSQITQDFFFNEQDGKIRLAIVRRDFYSWDERLNALDLTKISSSQEERYYFENGAMTHWHTKREKNSTPSEGSFADVEKRIATSVKVFLKVAKSPAEVADVESFLKGQ